MKVLEELRAIMDRTGVGYTECASAAHISPSTLRWCLAVGDLPRRLPTRARVERFVALNREAQSRGDLRFIPS